MDEPTNHLDMATREALTVALSSFGGALLVVSHDRHLLRATTDQLWLVNQGRLQAFDGDLDDYASWVLDERRAQPGAESPAAEPVNRSQQRRAAAAERERLARLRRPVQRRLEALEQRVQAATQELKSLDAQLSVESFYRADPDGVGSCLRRRGDLQREIQALEEQWFELQARLESIV